MIAITKGEDPGVKATTIVTGILTLLVGLSAVYLIAKDARNNGGTPKQIDSRTDVAGSSGESDARTNQTEADKVLVYYFHGTVRCATCRNIEAYAEEAIRTSFPDDLASGKMVWRALNTDEPENSHFLQDYQLVTSSLVLVGVDNNVQMRWKNLDKVWQYVDFKPQFNEYVVESTREFMGGGDE
jgi:hypothetical protein